MSWRAYQRIFELISVVLMMAGIVMMWLRKDPHHHLIYGGFVFLASGKVTEALNIDDPYFKIIKLAACTCIYVLVMLNLLFNIKSIVYILLPLGTYYALQYRWMFQQRKT